MSNIIDRAGSTISAFIRGVLIVCGSALALYLLYQLAMFLLSGLTTH